MTTQQPLYFLISLLLTLTLTSATPLPLPQNGDGGGASGVSPGDLGSDPSAAGNVDAGAAGDDTGSVNLSKGATIAIAVVVAIVVILGITSAVLFYLAKKRQWTVRTTIRRTTTRVVRAMTPRTPHKMTFSPIEKSRSRGEGDELIGNQTEKPKQPSASAKKLEKSRSGSHSSNESRQGQGQMPYKGHKQRPSQPSIVVPRSEFEIDSPKTPVWSKFFGR